MGGEEVKTLNKVAGGELKLFDIKQINNLKNHKIRRRPRQTRLYRKNFHREPQFV